MTTTSHRLAKVSRSDRPTNGALSRAYLAGHIAGKLGRGIHKCPWPHDSALGQRWILGRQRGLAENMRRMAR